LKHDFLDKYSNLDSPVHRLDPRVKILSVFLAIIIIVSEPLGELFHFLFYFIIIALLVVLSRVPLKYLLMRCLIVSPFILMAAAFLPLSRMLSPELQPDYSGYSVYQASLTILFKAYSAVILLVLLTSTEKFQRLLLGIRKLKMPRLIGVISALMYRYIFLLTDEVLKTTRARESRTPGKLKISKVKVYGNQMAMIFIRSWERAHRVYDSMLSRGFNGEFPDTRTLHLSRNDVFLPVIFVGILLVIRLGI
jgi:cobalt/nickel transport system permease protein